MDVSFRSLLTCLRLIALLAAGLCALTTPLCAAEIRLKAQVSPTEALLTLGDIADVHDADPEVCTFLKSVSMGPAPAAGRTARIEFDQVRKRLAACGVNLATVHFSGSQRVQVGAPATVAPSRPVEPVSSVTNGQQTRAQELVKSALEKQLPSTSGQPEFLVTARVNSEDVMKLLRCPQSGWTFSRLDLPVGGPHVVTLTIPPTVSPRIDTGSTVNERTSFEVLVWVAEPYKALVLRNAVPKNYLLQPADLAWRPASEGTGLTSLAQAVGKETTRSLRAEEFLQTDHLQDTPLIRHNDIVTAKVQVGGITVRREFKATSAGAFGEVVSLVSLEDSRERLQARVTAFHEAEALGANTRVGSSPQIVRDATGSIEFQPESSVGRESNSGVVQTVSHTETTPPAVRSRSQTENTANRGAIAAESKRLAPRDSARQGDTARRGARP